MTATTVMKRFSPGLTLTLAAFMLVLSGLALWYLGRGEHLESVFVRESHKAQLVSRMRADLYAAAEAEKSAVLAETDNASLGFAKSARAAADQVAAELNEFKGLPPADAEETSLLRRFEEAFAEYRKADEEVLNLAVQNTNLKAYALSFGPASEALEKMELALQPVLVARGKGGDAALHATRGLAGALRIQTLQAPHIAERTEERMDELEKRMDEADKGVRADLTALGAAGTPALAAYEHFQAYTGEIVRLSRLNTNVRSLDLSLGRKVKVLAVCDEVLQALKEHVGSVAAKATR